MDATREVSVNSEIKTRETASNCTPGYAPLGNTCTQCTTGQTSNGGNSTCHCPYGSYFLLIGCRLCDDNYYSDIENAKDCKQCANGLYSKLFSNTCISEGQCDVKNGFVLDKAKKTCSCPDGKKISYDRTKCIDSCGADSRENTISTNNDQSSQTFCSCVNGYIVSLTGDSCILPSECIKSGPHEVKNYMCVCINGFEIKDGKCQEKPLICEPNMYQSVNKCYKCPANSTSPGGNATECTCLNDMIWSNKQCISSSDDNDTTTNKTKGLTTGAIVGIVIGVLAILLTAILVPVLLKKRSPKNTLSQKYDTSTNLIL